MRRKHPQKIPQTESGRQKKRRRAERTIKGTRRMESQKDSLHLSSLTLPMLSLSASLTALMVAMTIKTSLLLGSAQNPPAYSLTLSLQVPPMQNCLFSLSPLLSRA